MPVASVALALFAALLFAVSVTLQQSAARDAAQRFDGRFQDRPHPRRWLPVLGMLGDLIRSPQWLAGWLLNVVGFAVHAIALHLGSITVVQCVLVSQLMLTLLVAVRLRRQRVLARDWWGTAAVCVGVGLVIMLRGPVPHGVPSRGKAAAAVAVAALVIVAALALAKMVDGATSERRQLRSAIVAIGAGTSFATTAVMVVVLTDDLARQGVVAAVGWPLPCLIVSAVVGSLLVQDSFASGSLPTALTAMTITDPVMSGIAGIALFDTGAPPTVPAVAALTAGLVIIGTGVVVLANSPTLRDRVTAHPEPAASRSQRGRRQQAPSQSSEGSRPADPAGTDRLDAARS
jgi:hypothetical protein